MSRSPCWTFRSWAATGSTPPRWSRSCAGEPRPPEQHLGRYRLLAQRGVGTVFVALPDLAGPDDVLRLGPVAAGFAAASG
jgi:hypothetical protein